MKRDSCNREHKLVGRKPFGEQKSAGRAVSNIFVKAVKYNSCIRGGVTGSSVQPVSVTRPCHQQYDKVKSVLRPDIGSILNLGNYRIDTTLP